MWTSNELWFVSDFYTLFTSLTSLWVTWRQFCVWSIFVFQYLPLFRLQYVLSEYWINEQPDE